MDEDPRALPATPVQTEEQRRDQTKKERRDNDDKIRLQDGSERQIERSELRHEEPLQKRARPQAEQEPERAADARQHDAFRHELAHDLTARRTEGKTDRDLRRAGRAARQHHVGEIQAADEQDHARHAKQEQTDEAQRTRVTWRGVDAERFREHEIARLCFARRVERLQPRGERRQLRSSPI